MSILRADGKSFVCSCRQIEFASQSSFTPVAVLAPISVLVKYPRSNRPWSVTVITNFPT